MAELGVLKKENNREAIKAYLTLTQDTHTLKYKPFPEDYKRQFVLIGTTNETVFLNDDTGERRFPIVECANKKQKFKKSIFDENSKSEIQQILAEAFEEYKNGARLYDVPPEFQEEMERIQSGYRAEDTDKGIIEDYLQDKKMVCLLQIWREAFEHKKNERFTSNDKNKIVKVLSELPNWQLFDGAKDHRKEFKNVVVGKDYQGNPIYANYGKQKAWVYVEPQEPENGNDWVDLLLKEKVKNGEQLTHEDYTKAANKNLDEKFDKF